MTIVSPSILASDFLHLGDVCTMLNESSAEWVHIDIMDGVFVPNISFGTPIVKAVNGATKKVLDVHLMIVEPQKYIKTFSDLGADNLNVHYEACTHLNSTITEIKVLGMRPCVTLNPSTPVSMLEDVIDDLYMVLLMSVNPGFGGQAFIPNTLKRIQQLKELIMRHGAETLIEVDGGITADTGAQCVAAGADVLVAGSYVFSSKNPIEAIEKLRSL